MLNIQSTNNNKSIEIKPRNIEIVVDEERNFSFSVEISSVKKLIESHCVSKPPISLNEVCSLDPFNFKDIINAELSSLKRKLKRYEDSPTYISKLAGLTTLTGDFDSAEVLLSNASENTGNKFLMQSHGNICVLKGDLKKAFTIFSKSELSNDVFSQLRLAYLKTKSNELEEAQVHIEKALEIDPSDYRTRMFSGAMHLNDGECEKAIRDFRVASEQKDNSSALHVNLAASHWFLGHNKKAIKELSKAISIDPLNENAVVFYSDALFSVEEYEKPIKYLEYITRFDEKSEFIWSRLARSYYFTNKYIKAKIALEKQMTICDDPSIWNNLGLVHWKLKDSKKAFSYFYHSIDKSNNDPNKLSYPILNLANILNDNNRSKECLKFFELFKNIDTRMINEDIKFKLDTQTLIALEATNDYESLIKKIDDSISNYEYKNKENIILLYVYKIYSDTVIKRSLTDAMNSITKILSILSNSLKNISIENKKLLFNNICFCLLYFGKTDDAEKYISKILNYIHIDPFCTATLGLLKIQKGEIDDGKKLYEEAISLTHKHNLKARIRQRMFIEIGKYFLNNSNYDMAKKYFVRAFNEKQGHLYAIDEAKQFLKSLS